MQKKDKKEEELEKLESGFNTYVNGAHKKNEKYTPRYTITKASSTNNSSASSSSKYFSNSKFNLPINLESLCTSRNSSANVTPAPTSRKKWGNSSFIFKTTDGCEIKISSPNHYKKQDSEPKKTVYSNETSNECEYSDDFESDDDTNANSRNKSSNENLIETVKFSSDEEDTTEINNKKNFVFKLTKNDIKVKFIPFYIKINKDFK